MAQLPKFLGGMDLICRLPNLVPLVEHSLRRELDNLSPNIAVGSRF